MPYDGTHLKPEQQVLLKAAAILREKGWCQNALTDGRGYCALGALIVASGGEFNSYGAPEGVFRDTPGYLEATDHLRKQIGGGMIPIWNNAPGRTAEEVATAMEAAAMMED